ncbi:MAG TPA: Asp-tRNA(Asn)/Glu-tRNA(Gln) amidotransferase subunit GatB [Bacteroidia bacterium]|nr:Asp-tRNA(Asn)/Glu-tRNA(Gln) amidotransferase subunit GatB [Bacteroidia bacterium]HRH08183.1 Asp-tRNA(Asn)/Glu-tRNA(Gln) amidotransferase subunit GatB [Bacteroidia bacterium]
MEKYEAVIGLEVHIQLLTKSKAYAADSTEYGNMPNSNVSAITLGHPGTLPKSNKKVIEYAVKLGLACHCDIREVNEYARKNYFYADLPKGYQITQDKTPICTKGFIPIKTKDGVEKIIHLTRIHMEEDAGKSMHDQDPNDSLIDLNRAGIALLEMVSEPELRSGEEAYAYLTEVRKLVRYLEICDGNMEEGSMRCDANISVRLKGDTKFGNRVEVKNMNSIRNVQRAIEFEVKRQIEEVEAGRPISQDTRSFEAETGTTFILRSKEMANDYRYFPEPDLQPVIVSKAYIEEVRKILPPLPNDLHKKYVQQFGLSEYDAGVITDTKDTALYFEELIQQTKNYKAAANWLMGPIRSYINENAIHLNQFPLAPKKISELIDLIDSGRLSHTLALQQVFPKLIEKPSTSALQIAEENNLVSVSDADSLTEFVKQALAKYPEKVVEYKNGKLNLAALFMGEVMKLSKGKADPKTASALVKKMLEE